MHNKILSSNLLLLWVVWGIYMISGLETVNLLMKIGAFLGMIVLPVGIGCYIVYSFTDVLTEKPKGYIIHK
jgi:hypothetical protein